MKSWFILLLLSLFACSQPSSNNVNYPEEIGDIDFDSKLDDPVFKICTNRVYQYYNFGKGLEYKGEKTAIEERFKKVIETTYEKESGYITIRFIVNCEGKTDRFSIQQMNINYEAKKFNDKLVTDCLAITKALDGWNIKKREDQPIDYYQYLTFKIEEGRLMEILP